MEVLGQTDYSLSTKLVVCWTCSEDYLQWTQLKTVLIWAWESEALEHPASHINAFWGFGQRN